MPSVKLSSERPSLHLALQAHVAWWATCPHSSTRNAYPAVSGLRCSTHSATQDGSMVGQSCLGQPRPGGSCKVRVGRALAGAPPPERGPRAAGAPMKPSRPRGTRRHNYHKQQGGEAWPGVAGRGVAMRAGPSRPPLPCSLRVSGGEAQPWAQRAAMAPHASRGRNQNRGQGRGQ